eukprot:2296930-Rhodomonas_salina.1
MKGYGGRTGEGKKNRRGDCTGKTEGRKKTERDGRKQGREREREREECTAESNALNYSPALILLVSQREEDTHHHCGDTKRSANPPTLRNQKQETTISVQFVPGMRFLVFDFAV